MQQSNYYRAASFLFLASIGLFFASFSFLFAQEEVFFEDDHDPSEYVPFRDTPYEDVEGSVDDAWYGIIYYDIYERAYKVEDYFPLGYSATVEYEYYPKLYETSRGWEPIVSREVGVFMRSKKEIASYVKTFNEAGEEVSYDRNNFSVVIPIMKVIGEILGIAFDSDNT